MRKLAFVVAFAMLGTLLGVAPAVAQTQPAPDVKTFCDTVLKVDQAFTKVTGKGPTKKQQQQIDQALAQAESTAPPDIAPDVQSLVRIIQSATQSNQDPSQNPTFEQNLTAVNQYLYNSCGYPQVNVTALEYEFQGIPKTLKTGTVAIQLTDKGAEVHELSIARLKTSDSLKKILGLSGKEQAKRVDQHIPGGQGVVEPGQTAYLIVQLTKSGRYGAACFIPVGTTSLAQLQSQSAGTDPHWKHGMYQQFTVEKA